MTERAQTRDADVVLGVVIAPHGLKGEVKVKTFTADPTALGAYGPLHAPDGRQFEIAAARPAGGGFAIVRFDGIADRRSAESLKCVELRVPRGALPQTEADEFYAADLVGLAVEDRRGHALGCVRDLHNFGASDVLEIEDAKGETRFLAFTREWVPLVDVKGGRVVVAWPEETEADLQAGR